MRRSFSSAVSRAGKLHFNVLRAGSSAPPEGAAAFVGGVKESGMIFRLVPAVLLFASVLASGVVSAATRPPAEAPETFASAQDAATALFEAAKGGDVARLKRVLGPGSSELVSSGDPTQNANERRQFVEAYAERHQLVNGPDGQVVLHVGSNGWPAPIPIVQTGNGWRFDAQQGAQDIVDRRIGRNEIAAVRVCLAYFDAQHAYFDLFKQNTGSGAYAQRLVSTKNNYDGLYWPKAPGIPDNPLQPLVSTAIGEGYPGDLVAGKPVPYQGYFFKVLKAQGQAAPGGVRDYVAQGKMTNGFALLAWPARYGASGIMSFIIGPGGVAFQKDLGPATAGRAATITRFDPDLSWARVDISGQDAPAAVTSPP